MTYFDETEGPEAAPDPDEPGKPVKNPHDAAFKSAFKRIELARSFFKNCLPEHLSRRIDLDHLKIKPGSYVDKTLRDRHSDLVYATRFSGREALLYLLLEHQSAPDPEMPYRVLCYVTSLLKDLRQERPDTHRLPAILPIVLYHGATRWTAPMRLTEMCDGDPAFFEYMPDVTYLLLDLGALEDEALIAMAGGAALAAVLYQFKHIWDADLAALMRAVMDLLREIQDRMLFLALLRWALIYAYWARNDPEEAFRKVIEAEAERIDDEQLRREAMTLGERIEKRGMERGLGKGRTELLIKMLKKRFGPPPRSIVERLERSNREMLDLFGESLFDFKNLKDAERWWESR